MKFSRKIELSVSLALIFSVIFSFCSFADTSEKISDSVLRLHVIANSDTSVDQNLKLRVRDAVLACGAEIFDGSVNVENAVAKITPKLGELRAAALNEIKNSGFDYDVNITIKEEFFTTRTYEQVTLPAGTYLALRVVIGKGEGHNWWCVMFPPMCLGAASETEELADVLDENELRLVSKNPKYEPKFKLLEIYQDLKHRISNH